MRSPLKISLSSLGWGSSSSWCLHPGASFLGVVSVLLLFSPLCPLFQWGQHLPSCIVFGCQETNKRVFYGQTSWHKNPFGLILLILWAPQVPRQFCSPIHWEVWLEITRTGLFPRGPQRVQSTSCWRERQGCQQAFHLWPCVCFSMRNGEQLSL